MHAYSMPMAPAEGPSADDFGNLRVLKKQPFKYLDANGLLSIQGLERLDPARLQHKTRRKVLLDANTEEGDLKEDMNVLSDALGLTCFKYGKDARSWSMNLRCVNVTTAPSLVYMQGGQEVSCCCALLCCEKQSGADFVCAGLPDRPGQRPGYGAPHREPQEYEKAAGLDL